MNTADSTAKPTATARRYPQFGIWLDVQMIEHSGGSGAYTCLMSYSSYQDGTFDEDPAAIEFVCPHMVALVNKDFGASFSVDDFQLGDKCSCETE